MILRHKGKVLFDTDIYQIYCIFAQNIKQMKRFGIIATLLMLLLGLTGKASAQFRDLPDMKGKMIYGGNIGGGFSGNYLSLLLAPQIGYRIFNPWEIGVRGNYRLNCYFDRYNGNQTSHYIGVAPYTNFQVFRGLFIHVEDEVMFGFSRWNHQTSASRWFNSLFVGGGFRQYTYSGDFVYFLFLYNLSWGRLENHGWDTPYSSPFELRVGYCFGR